MEEFSERKIINGVFYLQDLPTALKVAKDGDKICLKSGNYILNKITDILSVDLTTLKAIHIHVIFSKESVNESWHFVSFVFVSVSFFNLTE